MDFFHTFLLITGSAINNEPTTSLKSLHSCVTWCIFILKGQSNQSNLDTQGSSVPVEKAASAPVQL